VNVTASGKSELKVLFISPCGLYEGMKGWPEYNLAKELVREGCEVVAFTSTSYIKRVLKYPIKHFEVINGIRVYRFPEIFHALPSNRHSPVILINWKNLALFVKALSKIDADVIHAHFPFDLTIIASIFNENFMHKPFILTTHDPFIVTGKTPLIMSPGQLLSRFITLNPVAIRLALEGFLKSYPYRYATKIIAFTNYEKKILVSYGVDERKIVIIPNGVSPERFKKLRVSFRDKYSITSKHIVLNVAQYLPFKGQRYLIHAIPLVLKEIPDVSFIFIGYNPALKPQLERLAQRLNVTDNVRFLVNVSEENLASAYKECDIFVFPSLQESFGLVLLEAMAAGKPVIASDIGPIREIVRNGVEGFLTTPKNPHELAEKIITLLTDDELRLKMGMNAKKRVEENFTWKVVAKRTLHLYKEVV